VAIKNGINKEMIESDIFLFFDIELIIIKTNDISNNKSKGITPKNASITTKLSPNGDVLPNIIVKKNTIITILFFIIFA
jgi:hypothetical protein